MLYNIELELQDIARLKKIKEREKAELANPFNSKRTNHFLPKMSEIPKHFETI
jgi:hypothetical protein